MYKDNKDTPVTAGNGKRDQDERRTPPREMARELALEIDRELAYLWKTRRSELRREVNRR